MADRRTQPQLKDKEYVGRSFPMGLALAVLAILALPLTICTIFWSLKESFDENYGLIILPSIPLYSSGCDAVKSAYYASHFALNLLGSTIVLVSFYLQQLCASPSYKVISKAIKAGGGDVPFGSPIPAALGLFRRRGPLPWLWLLLLLTSMVMHLCLNGTIGYQYHLVPTIYVDVFRVGQLNPLLFQLADWTNLTAQECQSDLRQLLGINVDVGNMTLVVANNASTNYVDYFGNGSAIGPNGTYFNANWSQIEYCFENRLPQVCSLTARWAPLAVFTGAMILKAVVVLLSLAFVSHFHHPLYTNIGEILQLAIECPEVAVVAPEECLQDGPLFRPVRKLDNAFGAVRAVERTLAWWRLMLASDWLCYIWQAFSFALVVYCIYESTIAYFPIYLTHNVFTVIGGQGFGTPLRILWRYPLNETPTGITTSSQLTLYVFMGNAPQVWLAICMFCANNHVTRIWMEGDWRGYYLTKKRPRIGADTRPGGPGVRKTRIPGPLPYLVTAIQFLLSATAHWMVSQAFFVVETALNTRTDSGLLELSRVNFYITHSPLVIAIGGLGVFVLLVIMTVHICFWKRTGMPVMNGSVRVVLASCAQFKAFDDEGIAWGKVAELGPVNVAGFGSEVQPLVPGNYGAVTLVGTKEKVKKKTPRLNEHGVACELATIGVVDWCEDW